MLLPVTDVIHKTGFIINTIDCSKGPQTDFSRVAKEVKCYFRWLTSYIKLVSPTCTTAFSCWSYLYLLLNTIFKGKARIPNPHPHVFRNTPSLWSGGNLFSPSCLRYSFAPLMPCVFFPVRRERNDYDRSYDVEKLYMYGKRFSCVSERVYNMYIRKLSVKFGIVKTY